MVSQIKNILVLCLFVYLISGCQKFTVKQLDPAIKIKKLTIIKNPKVTIPDFIEVLKDSFQLQEISCDVVEYESVANSRYILLYSARRSWDLKTFLRNADLKIYDKSKKPKELLSYGTFYVTNSLNFSKFNPDRNKIFPLVNEMITGEKAKILTTKETNRLRKGNK